MLQFTSFTAVVEAEQLGLLIERVGAHLEDVDDEGFCPGLDELWAMLDPERPAVAGEAEEWLRYSWYAVDIAHDWDPALALEFFAREHGRWPLHWRRGTALVSTFEVSELSDAMAELADALGNTEKMLVAFADEVSATCTDPQEPRQYLESILTAIDEARKIGGGIVFYLERVDVPEKKKKKD